MTDREGGGFCRTMESTGEQKNAKLAARSRAERHPQRVGLIAGVVAVRQLSNHDAISSEGGGRYGQDAGMEDEIWKARGPSGTSSVRSPKIRFSSHVNVANAHFSPFSITRRKSQSGLP
jgi:hypothetical protein